MSLVTVAAPALDSLINETKVSRSHIKFFFCKTELIFIFYRNNLKMRPTCILRNCLYLSYATVLAYIYFLGALTRMHGITINSGQLGE